MSRECLKSFVPGLKLSFHTWIQVFRTNNGKEYFNSILGRLFKEKGIIHQSTCFDTPQQNGIVERKNCHLIEVARLLMFTMGVPKYLWDEAVLMPTKMLKFATHLNTFWPSSHIFASLLLYLWKSLVALHLSTSTNKIVLNLILS